jgi:hypothetical protein
MVIGYVPAHTPFAVQGGCCVVSGYRTIHRRARGSICSIRSRRTRGSREPPQPHRALCTGGSGLTLLPLGTLGASSTSGALVSLVTLLSRHSLLTTWSILSYGA